MREGFIPYIVGGAIRQPEDFYGRVRQVERFYEIVAGTQVQSASVLGLRRAGKTSFLRFVAHPDVMAAYLPDAERYVMVYMDVSASRTPADFYHRLYRNLAAKLYYPDASLSQAPITVPRVVDAYECETLLYDFPDRRVIVLLDEFDQLRAADFDSDGVADFLTDLRALASVREYELAWITASYWDLFSLGTAIGLPPTSPFYNIFYPSPIYMSGLRLEEAEELISSPAERAGYPLDEDDVAYIHTIAGSLPFFLQATAAHWYKEQRRNRQPDPDTVVTELVKELSPYFSQWWRHFSDATREVLRRIAHQQPLDHHSSYSDTEINTVVRRLKSYGVIIEQDSTLVLNGLLLDTWVRESADRAGYHYSVALTNGRSGGSHRSERTRPSSRYASRAPMEPSLHEQMYEEILQAMHNMGKQFERLTSTYAQKGEEDLRDHFLLMLEPMFRGSATGETINKAGKTDILVRHEGSNVFIAECKFWKGPKVYHETIDQLLSYLSWRDAKAAVVVFVRNRDFSTVVRTVQQITPQHPNYLAYVAQRDESWLSYHFHLNGDPNRLLHLAVLLFHIPG